MTVLKQSFLHPDDEFSPLPFWFWNDALTETEITRQIDDFQVHGVAGFVIHPRKGLPGSIPYLGDDYMHFVRHAVEEAARRGMRVVLYDEAMYPSGAAHGMVAAENPDWASRCLWMEMASAAVPEDAEIVAVCAAQLADGCVLSSHALQAKDGCYPCPEDGRVLLVFREGFSGGTIRGIHENEDDGEIDAPKSADLLNQEAVQCFIRITHERYYACLAEFFGSTVTAMFTDEPDITGRNSRRGAIAWTRGFLSEFGCAEDLPALFLDCHEAENIRRRYRRAVNARMVRTYYQPLADWCGAHGIALTGHPAKGYDMGLLAPFQLPAQDVVWRFVEPGNGIRGEESVLAKCASDAARHHGKRRNGNECFGCCGPKASQWAMTCGDMKWYMDYLFVRGCNLLFPHAFYYSVRDGRGDERPPDAGPNNTWWPEYGRIAAYMRRLCDLMTDSVNQARVAVLCEGDHLPWQSVIPLYQKQIEFNYLQAEDLIACTVEDGALCISNQRYTHVMTGAIPLDKGQRAILERFVQQGGTLAGEELPRDAVIAPAADDLRISHVVKGGMHFYLMTNEGDAPICGDVHIPVAGRAEWWDAWNGTISAAHAHQGRYRVALTPRESCILAIDPAASPLPDAAAEEEQPLRRLPPLDWKLTREDGETARITADAQGRLPGWEQLYGWETHSGWVVYETEAVLAGGLTDLGEVHEMARVYANDALIGVRLWGPFVFELPEGAVKLRIEVANTPAGKMDGVILPSGMLG